MEQEAQRLREEVEALRELQLRAPLALQARTLIPPKFTPESVRSTVSTVGDGSTHFSDVASDPDMTSEQDDLEFEIGVRNTFLTAVPVTSPTRARSSSMPARCQRV
jgi:hypothetical protein